jgi:DNA polymerase elongation subunit (family B)
VVERVNGQRVFREYPAKYEFYYNDPKGKQRTIYGTPVSRFLAKSHEELQKELRIHSGRTWEGDINPVFKCLEQYYLEQPAPRLQTAFFDIETAFDRELGFSTPEDPFNPITAITVYLDWVDQLVTVAVIPSGWSRAQAETAVARFDNTFLFEREQDMLETFLDLIEDADVLSGWNSEGYDIPYTVMRIARVMSRDHTRRFCLWNQRPKKRKFERYGAEQITFDLIGRVHLDYMQLYRKYTYEERHSYSLDAIGEHELGERKVAYDGTLDQLYNQNFELFIDYNRQDTLLLAKMDRKLKFIDLANVIAHANTVLLATTMGAVAVTEQAIINEAHRLGMVVPERRRRPQATARFDDDDDSGPDPTTQAAGAYVMDPKKGMHEWVGAIDINSLYPSAIRALNMGPETIMGQLRPIYTMLVVNELKSAIEAGDAAKIAEYIKTYGLSIEQNRVVADPEVRGKLADYWDKRQLVKKINLNSLDFGRVCW